MLTGEAAKTTQQMDAFRHGEMRNCLKRSLTRLAAALGFSTSALELGLWREAQQLVPVKFGTVHVKNWLDHVESLTRHVNYDLVHVNGRTFSSTATDGGISPWGNAQVLEKEQIAENGKK